jgi:hypothetical protein
MQGRGVKHARRRHAEDERFIPGGERFVIETMPLRQLCTSALPTRLIDGAFAVAATIKSRVLYVAGAN